MAVSAEAFDEPWRVVCSRGHANLEHRADSQSAYCYQCGRLYDYDELVDRKESRVEK